jgi:hypothetical protein
MWKKREFFLLESNVKQMDLYPSQKVENNTHAHNVFTNCKWRPYEKKIVLNYHNFG